MLAGMGLDETAPRFVFVDGYLIESLSDAGDEPAIEVSGIQTDPRIMLGGQDSGLALDALNQAFAGHGAIIQIHDRASAPLRLVFFIRKALFSRSPSVVAIRMLPVDRAAYTFYKMTF